MTLLDYAGLVAVIIISGSAMIGAVVLSAKVPQGHRDHLCPVAEISPDITIKERERCRRQREK